MASDTTGVPDRVERVNYYKTWYIHTYRYLSDTLIQVIH